jgi:hypothetical protein
MLQVRHAGDNMFFGLTSDVCPREVGDPHNKADGIVQKDILLVGS